MNNLRIHKITGETGCLTVTNMKRQGLSAKPYQPKTNDE